MKKGNDAGSELPGDIRRVKDIIDASWVYRNDTVYVGVFVRGPGSESASWSEFWLRMSCQNLWVGSEGNKRILKMPLAEWVGLPILPA